VFDFTNGFHDAANSIATVVSTRVLTPRMAVIWAASSTSPPSCVPHQVANTVGKTVDPAVVSEAVVFAGLVGAIAWNLTTWWLGLPTSSSHALIGGFAGAGVAKAGFSVLNAASLEKTILFIVVSPLFGMVLGFLLMLANLWLFRRATPAEGRRPVPPPASSSRRPPSASATGATTPRRPWGIISRPAGRRRLPPACRPTATCRSRSGW
jgi:PiT family inorganic phosphate transporter